MDGDGTLANGRSDAFDVVGANVADGEDAGEIRLEHLRWTRQPPSRRFVSRIGGYQITSCENEAFVVESDAAPQPFGPRRSASHDEHMGDIVRGTLASGFLHPRHALQVGVAMKLGNLALEVCVDVRVF